ncbi:hypothetical protein KCP70_05940 [Salmonella enterica subsp. enterica]|nr:hypothetical protein KCP70_05940 [Salmonella enterica subsp. enterica]
MLPSKDVYLFISARGTHSKALKGEPARGLSRHAKIDADHHPVADISWFIPAGVGNTL